MASYTGLKDMFDGGGAGQSGAKFEGGGILSAIGNSVARPAGSRDRGEPDMRTGIGGFARDAFNGGGWGASGETFQGGPYGGLVGAGLNALGVRPMGYEARGQQMLQQALANIYSTAPQTAPAVTSSAPMTSPRPPRQFMGPDMPTSMPTMAQGVQSELMPASRAIYGQNIPFGGYAMPMTSVQSAPVVSNVPPAPTGPVVGVPPQHTSMWNKLFPNGLY